MVPLYILGLLLRFGAQHGYQIKKNIETQLADFTQIKLSNIYYHLDKMEAKGLVSAQTDQEGLHPEKRVYQITDAGKKEFEDLLHKELTFQYRPTFSSDALFFFEEHCPLEELLSSLQKNLNDLEHVITHVEQHQAYTLQEIPKEYRKDVNIIFQHHLLHYQAELAWVKSTIHTLKGDV